MFAMCECVLMWCAYFFLNKIQKKNETNAGFEREETGMVKWRK